MSETIAPAAEDLRRLSALIAELPQVVDRVSAARQSGQLSEIEISALVAAAARLFADRMDRDPATVLDVPPDRLNATQAVMLIKALMEVTDINLFDLAIWYRRAG
ncbi:MAG: hypothetical protein H6898_10980 [Rhodobacter sp.]|nr:hypothetical protein [Paracoccaceae bacterium]MCC0077091.1 hypothetical protein [Rhodobacter sp.]